MDSIYAEIEKLSASEKLDLVEALWNDIARTRPPMPVPEAVQTEVLRRAAWRDRHPGHGKSLDDIVSALGVRL